MGEGFQFIEIIFFAMVAVFIFLRLRGVLGRRTGNEPAPPKTVRHDRTQQDDDDNVVPLPDRHRSGPLEDDTPLGTAADGVREIRAMDPSFSADEFVGGARTAYDMVLMSFAAGDTETLRALLDDDVYTNFQRAIADRESRGEVLETTLVAIKSSELVEARAVGRMAEATIKFVAELVNVTRDKNGEVISGDPRVVQNITDYWTFARDVRSADPNWKLIATRSEN
ncbi:MAG: Tim44/TimA family putative adaptor protein [Alphaproteobacteria bacterium]|jgi:predicted lipid-binding transport protein (Tim44 family)